MTDENDLLRALPLGDRLRIAAVDLAVTGAPRALVGAVWEVLERLKPPGLAEGQTCGPLGSRRQPTCGG
jgi:hypothetical protein